MKVLTYYKYQCDTCKQKYDTEKEAVRCEEIHGEKTNLSAVYMKRLNDNIHLWDEVKPVDFHKNTKTLKVIPDMLFLSRDEKNSSMSKHKLISARIKKLSKSNFEMNCTKVGTLVSITADDLNKCQVITVFDTNCDIAIVLKNINKYNEYFMVREMDHSVYMSNFRRNYYFTNCSDNWLQVTCNFDTSEYISKEHYNLIMKEKLKTNLTSINIKDDRIMVWAENVPRGYYIN